MNIAHTAGRTCQQRSDSSHSQSTERYSGSPQEWHQDLNIQVQTILQTVQSFSD